MMRARMRLSSRARPRFFAVALALLLSIFPAREVLADNRVRILFDDVNNTYRPRTNVPNPPTDGCRPAVDDSDDNGCVTEGGEDEDGDNDSPDSPP
jgi:hypothetical protein